MDISPSRNWIDPAPCLPETSGAGGVLTSGQVASWRRHGFAFVDGVLPAELLAQARADSLALFPNAGSGEAEHVTDFGSSGKMAFPSESAAANALTLHPRLLRAVAQLLDVDVRRLRLTQSDLWPKYGRHERTGGSGDNADQRMHLDYPNHYLTHPPPWERPEAVEILLYLSDVESCGGATAVVPRRGDDDPAYAWPMVNMPGVGEHEWINDRATAEATLAERAPAVAAWRATHLYRRERPVKYRNGSVLFYRHDIWHRGTPIDLGALRLTMNMTFRKAESEWISTLSPGWAWAMYRPSRVMERLIADASVEQRTVLGFPPPGHAYWTVETIDAVAARYAAQGIDMTAYRVALNVGAKTVPPR